MLRHNSKCPACVAEALEVFGESPANPHHVQLVNMCLNWLYYKFLWKIFGPFFFLNLTKMFSKLMFGHGKLIMRTYFTHVAITDQNWFYFFTPITLRIAHSALISEFHTMCLNIKFC